MATGDSPTAPGISVLDEMRAAVRREADAARASGLPLKTAAPGIARRLGLLSPRRVTAYLWGEVAEDDVRAVELEAVRRARGCAVRVAEMADDITHKLELNSLHARLAALEERARHEAVEDRPMAAQRMPAPRRPMARAG